MDDESIKKPSISNRLFSAVRTAFITGVLSSALLYFCAFMMITPFKARPGTLFFHDVAPTLSLILFGLFLFGGFWVEFSKRAYSSPWIRGCIYLAFVASAFSVCAGVY
jgi:hypothetical protein